jgi:hypothetical protein
MILPDGKWKMEDGKACYFMVFAIFHLPFTIGA